MNLAHGARGVGCVMQDTVGIDNIETVVGERQSFTVADGKVTALTVDGQVLSRDFSRSWRQIDLSYLCTAQSKLQKVCAHTTADFEETGAGEFIKTHYLPHPRRVLLVTMTLDGVK